MYSRSRTRTVNGGRQRRIDAIAERRAFLDSQLALLAAGHDQESRIPNIIRNRNRTGFKPQPRYVYSQVKALPASTSSSSGVFEQIILCSAPGSEEASPQSPESNLQTQSDIHFQEEVPVVGVGVNDLEQNQQLLQEVQGLDLETIPSQDGAVMMLLDGDGGMNLETQNQPENDFDFQTLNSDLDLDVDLGKAVEGEGELTETETEPDTYVIVETPEGPVLVPSAMYPQLVNNFNFNSSGVPTAGLQVEGQQLHGGDGGLMQVTTTSALEDSQIPQVVEVAPAPSSSEQTTKRKSQLLQSHIESSSSPRFSQNHHQHHNYTKSSTLIRPTFKSRKVPYKISGVGVGASSSSHHRLSQSQSSSVPVPKKKMKVIQQKPQIPQSQLSLSSLIKKINNNNNDVVMMAHHHYPDQDQEKPRPFRFELSSEADVEVDDEFGGGGGGGGFRNVPIPIMINSLRSETEKTE